jgi:hypothetical protein
MRPLAVVLVLVCGCAGGLPHYLLLPHGPDSLGGFTLDADGLIPPTPSDTGPPWCRAPTVDSTGRLRTGPTRARGETLVTDEALCQRASLALDTTFRTETPRREPVWLVARKRYWRVYSERLFHGEWRLGLDVDPALRPMNHLYGW